MPLRAPISKKVSLGCQITGSTRSSHLSAFSNRSECGTLTVYPSMPCSFGIAPVNKVARDVEVVDGNAVVISPKLLPAIIFGITSAKSSIACAPKPSIKKSTSRPFGDTPNRVSY